MRLVVVCRRRGVSINVHARVPKKKGFRVTEETATSIDEEEEMRERKGWRREKGKEGIKENSTKIELSRHF